MNYIYWFIKLRLLGLRNVLWKDDKAVMRTLSYAAAIIIGLIVLTNIFYRTIFSNVDIIDEMVPGMISLFFFVAVIWIYLISIFQSISTFMRNFYKSPDMNYLVTIPIPIDYIFLFKFFEYIISSAKSMLFLFFPFLAALGMWVNAPLIYYIAIIPIYVMISIIPCAIGAMVAMIGLKILPAKVFNIVTPGFTFAINIVFAVLFTRVQDMSAAYMTRIIEFFERPWISDVIPLTAGIRLFYSAIAGEWSLYALLFLLVTTILFVLITFMISKKLFLDGWANNQLVESKDRIEPDELKDGKKVHIGSYSRKRSSSNEIVEWMKTEWKMAARNHEMLIGSVFMLLFYLFSVFAFTYGGLFSNNPLIGVSLLTTIAAVFNIMAVSILFVPAEIKKDKFIWKNRYWLLKVMPIEETKVFTIQCSMYFIPGFVISLAGIIIYSAFAGLSIQLMLLSVLSLFLILYGSSAIYTSSELLSLTEFFENNALLANLMTIVLPVLYGILSAGSITLFLAKDYVSGIAILSDISAFLSFPNVILISVMTVIVTIILSRLAFVKAWQTLEI